VHTKRIEDDDDDDVVEPTTPVPLLPPNELTELVLDSLDIGVVLVEPSGKLLKRNAIADHLLAAFGTEKAWIPHELWSRAQSIIDSARVVPGRFTPASPISSPDKRRFFVRARLVQGSAVLLTIAPAALREIDVQRVLADHFGLTAQEIRIAFFAAQGYRNREIAERLEIVEGTVKNYLTNVFAALSVRSRTELASELAQLLEEQTDVHRRSG